MGRKWLDLRIVFMGTPEFAVASLDALAAAGANLVGVVTAPDKPAGRGLQLSESSVKKYALAHGLPLLQPEKLKDPAFLNALAAWKADVQVVVAFRMLPELVWNMPPLGTINVHGSLLPKYRGAAPINWAIINGETETGVTTFRLQHAIDTGEILLSASVPIGASSNAGEVHDLLKEKGADLIVQTLEALGEGTLVGKPQNDLDPQALPHAPKIQTETCKIDWNQPVHRIYNLIRGLSPYPTAFTVLDGDLPKALEGKMLKIFSAEMAVGDVSAQVPGSPTTDGKTYLGFAGTDGYIHVTDLQLEGKKRMKVEDFLRGNRIPAT
jgi:methionyl-tRNA formyltransferase